MRLGLGLGIGLSGGSSATPPTVTSISPEFGSTAGDVFPHVITGTGFTGASAVTFGGTNAASFVVDSATQITAYVPAKAAGTYDVVVTNAGGPGTLASGYEAIAIVLWRMTGADSTLNGSNISADYDYSGNANHPAQGTASLQPAYTSSDSAFANLPSADFDGTDDLLSTGNVNLTSGYTAFAVWRFDVLKNFNVLWATENVSAGHVTYVQLAGSLQVRNHAGVSGGENLGLIAANTKYLFVQKHSGSTVSVRLNGADVALTNAGSTLANLAGSYPIRVGGTLGSGFGGLAYSNGRSPILLVAQGALSGAQITKIETWINSRYGVY
jgi:hypothetical protein